METKSNKRVSPVGGSCRIFARSVRDAAANKNIKAPSIAYSGCKSNENSPLNDGDMKELHVEMKQTDVKKVPRSFFSPISIRGLNATSHCDSIDIIHKEKQGNELFIDQTLKDILNDQSKSIEKQSDSSKTEKNEKVSKVNCNNSTKNISMVSSTSGKQSNQSSTNIKLKLSPNSHNRSSGKDWDRKQTHENIENSKPKRQRFSRRKLPDKTKKKDINIITDCMSYKREYKRKLERLRRTNNETQSEDWNSELIELHVDELTALNESQCKDSLSEGTPKCDNTNVVNSTIIEKNQPEIWIKEVIVETVCKTNHENNGTDIKANDIKIKPIVEQVSLVQSLNVDSGFKVSNESMNDNVKTDENTTINCVEATDSDGVVYLQEGDPSGMYTRRPVFSRGGIKPPGVVRGESAKGKGCLNDVEAQNKSALLASQFMENFRKLQEQKSNNTEDLNKNPDSVSVNSSKCSLEGNVHVRFSQDYRKTQLYKATGDTENENKIKKTEGKKEAQLPLNMSKKHPKREEENLRKEAKLYHNGKSIDEDLKKLDDRLSFIRPKLHIKPPQTEKADKDEPENLESEDWTEELLGIPCFNTNLLLKNTTSTGSQGLISSNNKLDHRNPKLLPDFKVESRIDKQKIILSHCEVKQNNDSISLDKRQTHDMDKSSLNPSQHKMCLNPLPMKKDLPYIANQSEPEVENDENNSKNSKQEVHSSRHIAKDNVKLEENMINEKHSSRNSDHTSCSQPSLTYHRTSRSSTDEKSSTQSPELPFTSKSMQQKERKSTKPVDQLCGSYDDIYNYSRQTPSQPPPFHPSIYNTYMHSQPNLMHYYRYGYMYPPYYPYDYDPKYMTNTGDGWSSEEKLRRFSPEKDRKKNDESETKDSTRKKTCVEDISRSSQMTKEYVKKNLCHLITIPLREIQDIKQAKNLLVYVGNVIKGIANTTGCYYQADVDGNIPVLHVGATTKEKKDRTFENKVKYVDKDNKIFENTAKNEMMESELSQRPSDLVHDSSSEETPHRSSSPGYRNSVKGTDNIQSKPHEFHPHFPTSGLMQQPFSMLPVGLSTHTFPHPYYNPAYGYNMDFKEHWSTFINAESKNMSSVKSPNSSIVSYDITDEEESCDEESQNILQSSKEKTHALEQAVITSSKHEDKPRIVKLKEYPESSQNTARQSTGYEQEFPKLSKTNHAVPPSVYQYGLEYGKPKVSESGHEKLAENKNCVVLTVEKEKELGKIESINARYVPPHKRKFSEDKPFSKPVPLNELYCWQNWENDTNSNRDDSASEKCSASTYNRYQPILSNKYAQKNVNRYSFPEEERKLSSSGFLARQNNACFYRGHGEEKRRLSESSTNCSSNYSSRVRQDSRVFSSQHKVFIVSPYFWKKNLHQRCSSYKTKFIDTHCHLDFLFNRLEYRGSFKKFKEINSDCFPSNFEGCISIFCDPRTFDMDGLWKDLAEEDDVWIGMGCHPKHAKDFDQFAEDNMKKIITHPKVIAVGEIGLDYSTFHRKYEALQKTVFKRQLKLGLEAKKPIVIHCRDAVDDCLEIMEQMVPRNHKIHCHCFTGSYMQAERWLNMFPNLYLGLTPLVTYSSATASHDFARNVPLSRLILETDAPYFIPRNLKKDEQRFSFPGFAVVVAEEVARLKATSVETVLFASRQNTKTLFSI